MTRTMWSMHLMLKGPRLMSELFEGLSCGLTKTNSYHIVGLPCLLLLYFYYNIFESTKVIY